MEVSRESGAIQLASLKLAQDELSFPVYDHVRSRFLAGDLDKDTGTWIDRPELRTAIGVAAKKSCWFKDTTRGDLWFKAVSQAFLDADFAQKNLALELGKLWAWTEHV